MRYAVTGANGLIGKALCLKLAEAGHHVTAIFRNDVPKAFITVPLISVMRGDVTDKTFLNKAFKDTDGVFHVAAFAKAWTKDPKAYYDVNENGTRLVCEAALKNGAKRVVYTSSAGTHGSQIGSELIHESSWPSHYDTDYEQSKFNGRNAALSFINSGLEIVVVCPARVYAPDNDSESNVPKRMIDIYIDKHFGLAPSNGSGIGSYVLTDDVAQGHIIAMTKAPNGEEYLLGGENVSYNTFFKLLAELSGKRYPIIRVPYQLSLAVGKIQLFVAENFGIQPTITTPWIRKYRKHWGVSSAKISALGYTITPLKEGMQRVLDHRSF